MNKRKVRAIRKLWRENLVTRHPDMIGKQVQLPTGQIIIPERRAYQAMKGRRNIPI